MRRLQLLIICIILFVSTLSIPTISTLVLILLPLINFACKLCNFPTYLRLPKSVSSDSKIIFSILFLLSFLISTFVIALNHRLLEYQELILSFTIAFTIYISGLCINYKELPLFPLNFIIINLFAYAGGIMWVFTNVFIESGFVVNPLQGIISTRGAHNIWTQMYINGPSLDLYSYLGVSLISAIVYGFRYKLQIKFVSSFTMNLVFLFTFIIFALGLYSSIILGARTPWIVISVSFVACFLVIFLNVDSKTKKIIPAISIAISTALFVIYFETISASFIRLLIFFGVDNVFSRFEDFGIETGRYQSFLDVILGIMDYPGGGRLINISEGYAHNIWLDSAYDTGIISMSLLLLYHLLQIIFFVRLVRSQLPMLIKIFSTCSTIAFFAAFSQAPVIQSSIGYFTLSCFYFGSTIGILNTVEEESLKKIEQ
jgi:hypothetical protein